MSAIIFRVEVDSPKPIHDDALIECEMGITEGLEDHGYTGIKITRQPVAYFGCLKEQG